MSPAEMRVLLPELVRFALERAAADRAIGQDDEQ